ncbi:MAG: hypothetical protein S4CHLAM45_05660 [Chlamydiales bacterium]|nr:hypothetical protein [Chlamydiales bacterium]MCH9619893.1 hypothetical protein [Chlamydiales bacterium]MCH9622680.1 hypothetical protein [Chlamydiales bacterium]
MTLSIDQNKNFTLRDVILISVLSVGAVTMLCCGVLGMMGRLPVGPIGQAALLGLGGGILIGSTLSVANAFFFPKNHLSKGV